MITTAQGYSVLRRLDDELFVKMPVRPAEEDSELDTDESLIDALAYYVMAGLERAKAPVHMGMYHSEIDFNNDRLIETFLSDTTNESDKFQPYV
ncbi:MAG: hypothetical protein K0U20_09375 [Proteobacteria bacterium]|nr:hypothetical protein [Pseudomonadota bacterium]